MRHSLKFGQALLANSPLAVPPPTANFITDILIEYDGPQLIIAQQGNAQFLSLCIDEDMTGARWLEAPLSPLEKTAMMSGALAVRDVLLKHGVVLIETKHGQPEFTMWELEPSSIPDAVLPESDAMLPDYVLGSYETALEPSVPAEFHIAADGLSADRLSFSRLSSVMSTLQNVWNSLAGAIGAQELTLNAVAFTQGSFRVRAESDNQELFTKVARAYRELNRATYDENRLASTLSRYTRPIVENYAHYLSALNVNKLEVFAEWRDADLNHTAFVGYSGAQRSRKSLNAARSTVISKIGSTLETLTGHFEGFTRKSRRFEFYDAQAGRAIIGKVDKALRDTPITGELNLTRGLKYRVEIETVLTDDNDKPKHVLRNFARIQ
jgi:hypothetical protein